MNDGFQDVDDIVRAFGENAGASTDQILRDYYLAPQKTFAVNDGVRILSHPDAEDLEGFDPVGTVVEVIEFKDEHWGPYKIDVKFLGTWFYCKSEELEELSSSERLFYGV